jgi:hypothetical protein
MAPVSKIHGAIQAATRSGDNVVFAWTAAQDNPSDNKFPFPYIDMVVISASSMTVISQPVIASDMYAFGLPALATDGLGDIGISFEFGGGTSYNDFGVGVLTLGSPDQLSDDLWAVTGSDAVTQRFGDYVTIRPQYLDGATFNRFTASGYGIVLDSTTGKPYTDPHYVDFSVNSGGG